MAEDATPWWREGICAEIGSALFFMDVAHSVAEAKDACALCPVQLQCLADALEADLEYGVFGGLSRDQRRPLRKQVLRGANPMTVAARAIEREKKKRWKAKTSSRGSTSRRRGLRSATSESPETSARTGSPGDTR